MWVMHKDAPLSIPPNLIFHFCLAVLFMLVISFVEFIRAEEVFPYDEAN